MRNLSTIIKTVALLAFAAGSAAYVYFSTRDDPEEEEETKQTENTEMTAEKSSQETSEGGSQSLDESKMIDMINEVSDTMLIVFQQLGMMALNMAREGKAEEEIWPAIGERYKSTMAVVEKQICELHGISLEDYHTCFKTCMESGSQRFKNACWPCRFLLSKIENSKVEDPVLPEDLTVPRVLAINQAVIELSCRCMDRIRDLMCDELHLSPEDLKKTVMSTDSLKDQVFDLVVDAEKGSKRRVFEDEKVDEADMIICSLLFKENEEYETKMETLSEIRMEKLQELGLN